MIIFAILFGLISMLGYGLANAYAKPLSRKYNIPELIYMRGCILIIMTGLLSIPFLGNLVHWQIVLATIFLGLIGYLPVLAFTNAIKVNPLGIVAPITETSTLVTILLAVVFLRIGLNPIQWVAASIIILANIAISYDLKAWKQLNNFKIAYGTRLAFAAAAGFGLFYFFLIPSTKAIGPWLSAFTLELGITIAAFIHIKIYYSEIDLLKTSRAIPQSVTINALLLGMGTLGFVIGVRWFNTAIVTVLSNSSALVTTLSGAYLFREKLYMKDKIAAATIILGIAILSAF